MCAEEVDIGIKVNLSFLDLSVLKMNNLPPGSVYFLGFDTDTGCIVPLDKCKCKCEKKCQRDKL